MATAQATASIPYGGDQNLQTSWLSSLFATPYATLSSVLVTLSILIVLTRLLSVVQSSDGLAPGVKRARMVPYWIPGLGHGLQFGINGPRFLRQATEEHPEGLFAINLGGSTHNILHSPSLVKTAMQQRESTLRFTDISLFIMQRFFGTPKRLVEPYKIAWEELMACMTNTLMKEPGLSRMISTTVNGLQENVPNMITFSRSPVDMQPWERSSEATLISLDEPEVEIDLMSLMRDMMGHVAIPAVFGRSFHDNFPNTLQDIYALDLGVNYLIMGLPSWFPMPVVTQAYAARRRLRNNMAEFWRAMDEVAKGGDLPLWGDFDDVGDTIKARHKVYLKHSIAPEDREDVSVLWAMLVNANLTVFWHILHLLAKPGLVDSIREEIAPYVQVDDSQSGFGMLEPPRLIISELGLTKSCPLLKSSFFEALRLSSRPMSIRLAAKDVVLTHTNPSTGSNESYLVRKSEYVSMPHFLHMGDSRTFEDADEFKPDRYIIEREDGSLAVDAGMSRPFGGGPSMCKGRVFAERECLSLVASVLSMWDIGPSTTAGWIIPEQEGTTAVSLPVKDVRVRIKRRRFA